MNKSKRFTTAAMAAAAVTAAIGLGACGKETIEQFDPSVNINECVYGPAPIMDIMETSDTPDMIVEEEKDKSTETIIGEDVDSSAASLKDNSEK